MFSVSPFGFVELTVVLNAVVEKSVDDYFIRKELM